MQRKVAVKIQSAVQECLDDCYSSSNPLDVVAQYMDRLRRNPLWNDAEIDRVELAVHQMLSLLVSKSSAPVA